MDSNLTYNQAFQELRTISTEIQNETVPVDQLAEKLKRASLLIKFCQTKLKATETEVDNIIRQFNSDTP